MIDPMTTKASELDRLAEVTNHTYDLLNKLQNRLAAVSAPAEPTPPGADAQHPVTHLSTLVEFAVSNTHTLESILNGLVL